jgi:hypothetical protein
MRALLTLFAVIVTTSVGVDRAALNAGSSGDPPEGLLDGVVVPTGGLIDSPRSIVVAGNPLKNLSPASSPPSRIIIAARAHALWLGLIDAPHARIPHWLCTAAPR